MLPRDWYEYDIENCRTAGVGVDSEDGRYAMEVVPEFVDDASSPWTWTLSYNDPNTGDDHVIAEATNYPSRDTAVLGAKAAWESIETGPVKLVVTGLNARARVAQLSRQDARTALNRARRLPPTQRSSMDHVVVGGRVRHTTVVAGPDSYGEDKDWSTESPGQEKARKARNGPQRDPEVIAAKIGDADYQPDFAADLMPGGGAKSESDEEWVLAQDEINATAAIAVDPEVKELLTAMERGSADERLNAKVDAATQSGGDRFAARAAAQAAIQEEIAALSAVVDGDKSVAPVKSLRDIVTGEPKAAAVYDGGPSAQDLVGTPLVVDSRDLGEDNGMVDMTEDERIDIDRTDGAFDHGEPTLTDFDTTNVRAG